MMNDVANIAIAKGKDVLYCNVSFCLLAIRLTTVTAVNIFLAAIDNIATKILTLVNANFGNKNYKKHVKKNMKKFSQLVEFGTIIAERERERELLM